MSRCKVMPPILEEIGQREPTLSRSSPKAVDTQSPIIPAPTKSGPHPSDADNIHKPTLD